MLESSDHSVSRWLSGLKCGDEEAARQIFERCFGRLIQVAKGRLGGTQKRVADEEDVALSVFHSLCRGAAAGRFELLTDRDQLWQMLVAITQQKAVDLRRHNTRQKRGGGDVRGESAFLAREGNQPHRGIDAYAIDELTPEFLCLLEEAYRGRLDALRDGVLRRIAILRLEGYADIEIAAELGISLRTVERKLLLIRKTWASEIID